VFRFEFKYKISSFDRNRLVQAIFPFIELDKYALPGNVYEVRTVYFDSDFGNAYYEKANGLSCRAKIRIRYYPAFPRSEHAFIELKRKHGHKNSKTRVKVPITDVFNIIDPTTPEAEKFRTRLSGPDRVILDEIHYLFKRFNLKPVELVYYKRQAYVSKFDKRIRLTFDTNVMIRSSSFDLTVDTGSKYITPPNTVIMEVKFPDRLPSWLLRGLARISCTRMAISKFADGLEKSRFLVIH